MLVSAAAVTAIAAVTDMAGACDIREGLTPSPSCDHHTVLPTDPACFFQYLVQRYHDLDVYQDIATVVQVTERRGESPQRVETRIACEVEDGEFIMQTPASQVRESLGVTLPAEKSEAIKAQQMDYQLWMAPHLTLKFTEHPLEDFRAGVNDGFRPTEVKRVTINEKDMVQLELDSLSEDSDAHFDLFVNPDSMLIERIEGEQRLPDGASFQTTVEITPTEYGEVEDVEGIDDPILEDAVIEDS